MKLKCVILCNCVWDILFWHSSLMWYILFISEGPMSSCVEIPANHSSSSSTFFFFLPLLPDTALRLAIFNSKAYNAVSQCRLRILLCGGCCWAISMLFRISSFFHVSFFAHCNFRISACFLRVFCVACAHSQPKCVSSSKMVKLDVKVLRYLTKDDFRVLTAIEMVHPGIIF